MKTIIRNYFKKTKIATHKWNIYKIILLLFSFKFYHNYKNLLLNILIFHSTFKHN